MLTGASILFISMVFVGPSPIFNGSIEPSAAITISMTIFLFSGVAILQCPAAKAILTAMKKVGYPDSLETSSYVASLYNGFWFLGGALGQMSAGAMNDSIGFAAAGTVMAGVALVLIALLVTGIFLDKSHLCARYEIEIEPEPISRRSQSKTLSLMHSEMI